MAQVKASTKQATPNTAKRGQATKQAAPVASTRTYPTLPNGFVCHGQLNQQGQPSNVAASTAMFATPRTLGVTPSVGIPSGALPVVLCPAQPSMGAKYTSAYAVIQAAFTAAQAQHGKAVTAAQVQAHCAPWPAARPKANSAWRHVVRTLGVAWQPTA